MTARKNFLEYSRRGFLRFLGCTAGTVGATFAGLESKKNFRHLETLFGSSFSAAASSGSPKISFSDVAIEAGLGEALNEFGSPTEKTLLLEHMASGVPVVGARAGGIPDVIQHGENVLLFSPGNLDNLRNQLKLLLGNIHLRNKLGSQARIDTEAWSWEKSTLKLLDYYNLAKAVRRSFDPPSAL